MLFFNKRNNQVINNKKAIEKLESNMKILLCADKGHEYDYAVAWYNRRMYYKECTLCGHRVELTKENYIIEKKNKLKQEYIKNLKNLKNV